MSFFEENKDAINAFYDDAHDKIEEISMLVRY